MAIPAKHYTVKKLSEVWDCSQSHVYDLIDKRELKALRIGRAIRIPMANVEAYEAEHQIWHEENGSKQNTGSEKSGNTTISAGQKAGHLNASQRAHMSLLTQNHSKLTTSHS